MPMMQAVQRCRTKYPCLTVFEVDSRSSWVLSDRRPVALVVVCSHASYIFFCGCPDVGNDVPWYGESSRGTVSLA